MRKLSRLLGTLGALLILVSPPVATGSELDGFVDLVKAASKKALNDLELIKECFGMPEAPVLCNAADVAGTPAGVLACPAPSTPVTAAGVCNLKQSAGFGLKLGKKAAQLVDISGDFDTTLLMIGEEKSITPHVHNPDGSGANCVAGAEYVVRQDQVKLLFAAVQKGKLTATAPTQLGDIAGFVVEVNAHKSESFQQGPFFYCQKETHDQNASCAVPKDKEPRRTEGDPPE